MADVDVSTGDNLPSKTEFLLYRTQGGKLRIETRMQDETVWLMINQMAELFHVDKSGISRHLKNIYETDELEREATVAKFATVQNERNYLQLPGAHPTSLPLQHELLDEDRSRPFFFNLLPEGDIGDSIVKIDKVSKKMTWPCLMKIGGKCVGAVSVLPEGLTQFAKAG